MSAMQQLSSSSSAEAGDGAPRRRRPWKPAAAAAVAIVLFAGGVLVAQTMRSGPDPVSSAAEGLVLQELVLQSQQADTVINKVREASTADPGAVVPLAVELQTIAVQMSDLAEQATTEQLRGLTQQLADGYLTIGVGLATNSAPRVNEGVAQLEQSQTDFNEYLGVDPAPEGQAPQEDGQDNPAPQG